MATNNFKSFGIGAGANVTAQADYEALAALLTGFQSGKASSAQINKALRQSSTMAYVLAQYISDTAAVDVLDNGTPATILTNLKSAIQAVAKNVAIPIMTGTVGQSRNAKMNITAASASGTFLADELIVNSALGGNQYRLKSVNATINISTTGAGGMDTGAAPATGYVAVYVIYNPTSGAVALLGVDATSVLAPEVYGGANLPSGYTASALVAVWPTSSSQFVIGNLIGRKIEVATRALLSSSTVNASRVSLATTQFPLNAKMIYGNMSLGSTAASTMSLVVWGANNSVGGMPFTVTVTANGSYAATFSAVSVSNQTLGWTSANTAGTPTFGIGMGAYEF